MDVMGVFLMGMIDKIEDLVFASRTLASVEIVKDKIVILKMRCDIEHLSDQECRMRNSNGVCYKIVGEGLQVKEYGDTYVKVEGVRITSFSIEGDEEDE